MVGVVGRSHKVEPVRALGASAVIDRSAEPLWKGAEAAQPSGYDVVLDANGFSTMRASYEHLAPGGRLIVYGAHEMMSRGGTGRRNWPRLALTYLRTPRFDALDMITKNRSIMGFNLSYMFDRVATLEGAMTALLGWLEDGRITPPRVTEYSFSDVAAAHQAIESGETVGKLVLLPSRSEEG